MPKTKRISKFWFWFLSYTWGIIMSAIGSIVVLALLLTGHKPIRNHYSWRFEIGKGWGGMELGPFSIMNVNASQSLQDHEFGHALQNCYLGPLMIFISLASALRYWYREYLNRVKGIAYRDMVDYDNAWYEGTASYLGEHFRNCDE